MLYCKCSILSLIAFESLLCFDRVISNLEMTVRPLQERVWKVSRNQFRAVSRYIQSRTDIFTIRTTAINLHEVHTASTSHQLNNSTMFIRTH